MKSYLSYILIGFGLAVFASGPLAAQEGGRVEAPRGLWQTEPDILGDYLLVRTRGCGRNLCGRVERAKNRGGYDRPSDAVGQKVFWDMRPQAGDAFFGEYRNAEARSFDQTRVEVSGRTMRIRACDAQSCEEQIWKLVK